jgi:hypothetical protein
MRECLLDAQREQDDARDHRQVQIAVRVGRVQVVVRLREDEDVEPAGDRPARVVRHQLGDLRQRKYENQVEESSSGATRFSAISAI